MRTSCIFYPAFFISSFSINTSATNDFDTVKKDGQRVGLCLYGNKIRGLLDKKNEDDSYYA